MQAKADELNLVARLSEAVFGDGFLHYGLWPNGLPSVLSLSALGQAQLVYVDYLVNAFPKNVHRILDIGSGTGAISLNLSQRGFDMACISPSETMNGMARAKLPSDTPVYTKKFENFDCKDRFDLCIFAESFHYIDLNQALAQAATLTEKGVVIFDYFRRDVKRRGLQENGTRGTHQAFMDEVVRQNIFQVTHNEDLTALILPTFVLLDHLQSAHLKPLLSDIRTRLRESSKIKAWLVEQILGRQLDRLGKSRNRADHFTTSYEYRLITLERL
jgi:SAM-dependent methyltransferase